jgi:predicted ABC-type ATPase
LKKYILFAGVNGAGKSTLYRTIDLTGFERVNTDEILVADGGNWDNPKDTLLAMRKGINLINTYLSNGISFCQESTLTGKSILKNIKTAKALDYEIEMHYIGLENVEISIERVENRVKIGGHGIPEEDLIRRYNVSLPNLKNVFDCATKFLFMTIQSFSVRLPHLKTAN